MNVLITGGSKGIGRAIALRFAVPGNTIFVNYHSDEASAQKTVEEVTARYGRAVAIRVDVGTPEGCRELIERVSETTDRLDLVVHGAVKSLTGPTLELDPAEFAAAMELNGSALLYLTQAAMPLLGRGSSTEAFRSMFATGAEERLAAAAAANPSGRGVEVDDVANLVEFLASDAASMIQGQRLHVDGGLYLR